jgi:CSLREA domain-containing protein
MKWHAGSAALCVAASLTAAAQPAAAAAPFVVTTTIDEDDGVCDAHCSLREAIAAADDDPDVSTVKVPAGVYVLDGKISVSNTEIAIIGTGNPVIKSDGSAEDRVFDFDDPTDITIEGVTITDGDVPDDPGADAGGGIRAHGRLTLRNVNVVNNTTGGDGGGIWTDGPLTIVGGTFEGNSADGAGGGLFAQTDLVNITGTRFVSNSAIGPGGGIRHGAGFGDLRVSSSSFVGNETIGDDGGAISSVTQNLTFIEKSTIDHNDASDDGGGISHGGSGTLAIASSMISFNETGDDGGGLSIDAGIINITNSTFARNVAGLDGGGIYANGGATNVRFGTVAHNTADAALLGTPVGGGIRVASGTFTLAGSIVSDNLDVDGTPVHDCAGATGGSNNVFRTTGCNSGSDVLAVPDIEAPANNGGPTLTMAIPPGSIAADRVPTGQAPCSQVTSDQRGVPRVAPSDCDAGAYEVAECEGVVVNRVGTPGRDLLEGTPGDDGFLALGGRDTLKGGEGKDGMCGGAGNDKLLGGAGDDVLNGGAGTDVCKGQAGRDRAKNCETVA